MRMRRMIWGLAWGIAGLVSSVWSETAVQAAPAAPTFGGVERTIESIRRSWDGSGAQPRVNVDGWNALFSGLLNDLRAYGRASDDAARQAALDRVNQVSLALESVSWPTAAGLRDELREWLRPRYRLAIARKRLEETLTALPATSDPAEQAKRRQWVQFVQNDLGVALREYEGAESVIQRQAALRRLYGALESLVHQNRGHNWQPASELEAAMNDLFNRPNLDVAADAPTVDPIFDTILVHSGPVTRKGYVSMVTAGPKTGFGLLPSDQGIAFYNSQSMVSVTPIHDFHQKLEQDPQGQKAAKLYVFNCTTYDWSNLTITATITPDGLHLSPSASHAIDATIGSTPTCGHDLGRGIAGLIGMNQDKINAKVKEGAMPDFQQRIPEEAAEETQERLAAQEAERNADLRSKYLIGDDTAAYRNFLIKQLTMRSRPEAIFVGGRFEWRGAPDQRGADAPQPPNLAATIGPGVTADLHLGSLLTSAASGIWQQDQVRSVQNLMIVTRAVAPGSRPGEGAQVSRNVSYADYLKTVATARSAHDQRVQALRIARPQQPPEFSTDARGFLVALVHDFRLDVPAPDPQAGGNLLGVPAKVLRLESALVEVAISYRIDTTTPGVPRLKGRIEEFNPGSNINVLALNDDEKQGKPLTRFQSAIVMSAMGTRVRSQNIDINLSELKLPGFKIESVSPLDPSGWARVNLARATTAPLQRTEPGQDVQPPEVKGPGATPVSSTVPPTGSATVAQGR